MMIDVCGHVLRSISGTFLFCRRQENHDGGHTDGEAWWTPANPDAVAAHEWCRRCGGPNVAWSAPSPLWNYVMRGNDINGEAQHGDLVCMTCFVVLGAEAGLSASGWRLTLHPEPEGLTYETPSGRVWDAEAFLWVEREGVDRTAP